MLYYYVAFLDMYCWAYYYWERVEPRKIELKIMEHFCVHMTMPHIDISPHIKKNICIIIKSINKYQLKLCLGDVNKLAW